MALPRLVAALAATSFALVAVATTASATPKDAPVAGDPRAVAYPKNVAIDHPDACTVGGLTGTPIAPGKFTFTGGDDQSELNITAVPSGVTVTGVVVKGSDAYNVYLAAKLGAVPWKGLHAPITSSDKPAAISHWYACGVKTEVPPREVPPGEQPPAEQPPAEETPSSEQPAPPAAETPAAPGGAAQDELAATGFGSPWLIGLGSTLVLAGAGVLFLLRRRKA